MKVYVISRDNKPLMPTTPARARKMLRDNKAAVVQRTPFTIKLTIQTKEYTQPITLGVDAGSKVIGISATTECEELYSSEVALRTDIVELLATKCQYRRIKRDRLRYREPRFLNRKKDKGWLAPSILHKIDSHIKVIEKVHKILPITKVIAEVAAFDIQKLKNDAITGYQYQEGEQLGSWNVREYVLFRDNHTCQHCKGKSKDKILVSHHIQTRLIGGDAPNNLMTLCKTCHDKYHRGEIEITIKRGASFRDAAFMGIMRWAFYNKLKELYPDVSLTYGYITKNTRIELGLEKNHRTDAFCIAGNLSAARSGVWLYQQFVRKNIRSLHKANLLKGGTRKANKAEYVVHGYRLFDKVAFESKEYFVFGRRKSGYFDIRDLYGNKVNKGSVSFNKLRLLEKAKSLMIERRKVIPPTTLKGFLA